MLLSEKAITPWHVDFLGTAVFYFILRGSKKFFVGGAPTNENLKKFADSYSCCLHPKAQTYSPPSSNQSCTPAVPEGEVSNFRRKTGYPRNTCHPRQTCHKTLRQLERTPLPFIDSSTMCLAKRVVLYQKWTIALSKLSSRNRKRHSCMSSK